jgi:general secretion pathway protein B
MSIILEALRKSEAARRRNETPELFATMPTATPPTRTRPHWPWWAMAIVGIATLALASWLWSRTETSVGTATNADPSASKSLDDGSGSPSISNDESALTTASNTPTRAPTSVPVTTPAASVSASPAPPTQTASAPPASPISPPVIAPRPSASTSLEPAPRVDNGAMPMPPSASRPAETASSANPFRSPQSDTPLALADLDPGTRKQLPPLKLSMHVWNDTPSQRFVILDGQRLREGDVLGEIVIERITRDGAMLSWRGTAMKLEWR